MKLSREDNCKQLLDCKFVIIERKKIENFYFGLSVPPKEEGDAAKPWKLQVGEVVWGAARGSTAWPGKVESLGAPGSLIVWVRWYGGGGNGNNLSQVDVKTLKSLSDGLEAHHRARKKFRK